MTTRAFTVPGKPISKGRPRFARGGHTFTDKRTQLAEANIRDSYLRAHDGSALLTGALVVVITATFEIPASWAKKKRAAALDGSLPHVSRPDLDNVAKAVLDALNGIAFADDAQIVHLLCDKGYGETAGTYVSLREE